MLFRRSYLRHFIATLDALARSRRSTVWLEKTPDNILHIEEISRLVPGSRFIHLLRDAADVVASLYELSHEHPDFWSGPRDIDECFDKWLRNYRRSLSYAGHPHHILVHYEQLIAHPDDVLEALCDFLGIEFEQTMLEAHSTAASRVTTASEPWKADVSGPIQTRPSRKFVTVFDEQQQAHLLERMCEAGVELPSVSEPRTTLPRP